MDKIKVESKYKKLFNFIDNFYPIELDVISDPFVALLNQVFAQQINYFTFLNIWAKFMLKFENKLTPLEIINASESSLKAIGLSKTKIKYIKNVALEFAREPKLYSYDNLKLMTNKQIIELVTKINGIGTWSALMFLIFCLKRSDIITYDDFALKKGMGWLFEIDNITVNEFNQLVSLCPIQKTKLSLYLWQLTVNKLMKYPNIDYLIDIFEIKKHQMPFCGNWYLNIEMVNGSILNSYFSKVKTCHKEIPKIEQRIRRYLSGSAKLDNIPILITTNSKFQKKVMNEIRKIEYGKTLSYKNIAENLSLNKGYQAIGNACNKNNIVLFVPCHRVVGKEKYNYAYGDKLKKFILDIENKN